MGRSKYMSKLPCQKVLIEMENAGDINMANDLHKYCVSWFSIKVLTVGMTLFIQSWNSHPIPGWLEATVIIMHYYSIQSWTSMIIPCLFLQVDEVE